MPFHRRVPADRAAHPAEQEGRAGGSGRSGSPGATSNARVAPRRMGQSASAMTARSVPVESAASEQHDRGDGND
jgi:hypothetical protein